MNGVIITIIKITGQSMQQKTIVITGGGSGVGQALAWEFAAKNFQVYIVGRRAEALQQTKARFPTLIHCIAADISTEAGRSLIAENLAAVDKIDYLIQNAGIIEPIAPLRELTVEKFQQTLATNLIGPLFLTQLLLPKLTHARVLHASTLWAHQPAANFGSYCISKAAFYMSKKMLNLELNANGVLFGSASPGIADTPMLQAIRETESASTEKEYIIRCSTQHRIIKSATSAKFFSYLLLQTTNAEFTLGDWDIYETKHHPFWLGDDELPQPL